MPVPDDLQRFVDAQAPVYSQVLAELKQGHKTSHWMWFVFPQLRGLGSSQMAHAYGLQSAQETLAYWQHPVLGARLRVCTELVLAVSGRTVREIFGTPDDLKLRSCMTLFDGVVADPLFDRAMASLFQGERDARTLGLLKMR